MGADNWAKCPRCLKQGKSIFENLQRQVDDSYGKVPVEEFDMARANLVAEKIKLEGENTFRTFREDYEFYGAEDGEVNVSYKGQCTVCGLSMKVDSSHPIPGV